jgi:hypothetical protein
MYINTSACVQSTCRFAIRPQLTKHGREKKQLFLLVPQIICAGVQSCPWYTVIRLRLSQDVESPTIAVRVHVTVAAP